MRAGIGLVGLLVGVGVLLWVFAETEIPKAKVGKQVQDEARQLSGRGEDGEAATDSFETEAQYNNSSKLTGLVVTSVTQGGAMQTYYGLSKDDRITEINGVRINDISNGDEGLAAALVAEAFQKKQPLTVVRNGQPLELPAPPGSPATATPGSAAPGAPGTAAPDAGAAAPQPPARQEGNTVQDQLQRIQDAAGAGGQQDE